MCDALRVRVLLLIALSMVFLWSCGGSGSSLDESQTSESTSGPLLPEIITLPVRDVEATSARSGGVFTVQEGRRIISKGVCYHTRPNPSVGGAGSCTDEGDGFDDFDSIMRNVRPETTYYVRAYATNADGTVYGSEREFTTRRQNLLSVGTQETTALDKERRTAQLNGVVEGEAAGQVGRKGFVWATYPDPQADERGADVNLVRIEEQTTRLSASISGLRYGVQYYVRAFAELDGELVYGQNNRFVLQPYEIGETGPAGGLIFFYDEDDQYPEFDFLEAAPPMWSGIRGERRLKWGCQDQPLGGTTLGIGKGAANTRRITRACSEAESAIQIVATYEGGGYSDWFIPSRAELDLMWLNLHEQGLGEFQPEFYWSSTEQNNESAWGIYFGTGNQRSLPKWIEERVRPIRAF